MLIVIMARSSPSCSFKRRKQNKSLIHTDYKVSRLQAGNFSAFMDLNHSNWVSWCPGFPSTSSFMNCSVISILINADKISVKTDSYYLERLHRYMVNKKYVSGPDTDVQTRSTATIRNVRGDPLKRRSLPTLHTAHDLWHNDHRPWTLWTSR